MQAKHDLEVPLSCGSHVESQENRNLRFCPSKLVLRFLTSRLDGKNLLLLLHEKIPLSKKNNIVGKTAVISSLLLCHVRSKQLNCCVN